MTFEQSVGLLIATLAISAFAFVYRSGKDAIGRINGPVSGTLFGLVSILEGINIAYGQGALAQWQADSAQTIKWIRESNGSHAIQLAPINSGPIPAWVFELLLLVACAYYVLLLADVFLVRGSKSEPKDKAE